MQKALLVLSFGMLMAGCTKKAIVNSSNPPHGSSSVYQYSVDLTKVDNDKLEVSLISPKITTDEITFRLPKTVPGTYSTDDYGRYLSDFKAFDAKGNQLATNKLDVNSYAIKDAKKLHKISYKIDDTWDSPEIKGTKVFEPTGSDIVANKEYSINTHCFFGYFDGMKQLPYQVTFTKPSGFYGSTSLVAKNSTVTTDIFETENYMNLVDAPILYTQPDTTVLKIGGADILVSVYSPNKMATSKEIAANISTLLEAQKEYLGGKLPIKKYAFLIVLSDSKTMTSFGALEHSYSSFYYLPEATSADLAQTVKDVASHEFFHIVTPLNIHSEEIGNFDYNDPKMSKHLWMYEGLTEYAAGHMQAKYDLIDTPKYLDMLRQKITTMKGMKDALPFTEMSANVLDKYKNQYMNVYNKGALIGMCLDIKLRQLSGGKYGTQNLLQDLSKTYGKEQSFKDDELFDKITSLTFTEIRQFFATYVEGKDPLPLTDILQSVGIDYLPEATVKQASLGGISIGFNQKTNRLKVTSIDKVNDFGKQMGYKADDELVSVNGEAMEMMKIQTIMGEFGSKTKEGEIVTVEVVRKNAEGKEENVKLSAPAILVEVKQKNVLKLVENPTAEQLKLRKAWLAKP